MSLGPLLLVGILLSVATLAALSRRSAARARAREGTAVGDLPEPFATDAAGDIAWWFHSPSCTHCHRMRPAVDALAAQGRVHPVDASRHLDVARALSVRATPTLVRVRAGRILVAHQGVLTAEALARLAPSRNTSAPEEA